MHILKPDHFSQRLILAVICAPLRPIHQPKPNNDSAPFGFWPHETENQFVTPGKQRVSVLTLEWTKTVFATFTKLAASEGRLKIISFLVMTDCCHGNHSARSVISGHANPDWSKHSLMRCLRRSFTHFLLCSFYFQHLPQCPSLVLLISPLILNK